MAKSMPRRVVLANTKTVPELESMLADIASDPDSRKGACGVNIYSKSANRKIDDITWAIYSITKKEKPEYIRKASDPELKNW